MSTAIRLPRMTLDPFWSQRVSCWGDRSVLIDHRLDLHRAVDRLLLGEFVKEHLPVFGEIAPGAIQEIMLARC